LKFTKRFLFLAFALWAATSMGRVYAQPGNVFAIDKIVAKVNEEIILLSELEIGYRQAQANGAFRNAPAKQAKCIYLANMVRSKVLVAKAEIDSITVSDDQVRFTLQSKIDGLIAQMGDRDIFIRTYGKTPEEMVDELFDKEKEQLMADAMRKEITADISVTPSEVKRFFNNIPRDSLPIYSTQYTVGQIVHIPELGKQQKQAVVNQLLTFRRQIKSGEAKFADLAKQYSQDLGSGQRGGVIGFMGRGQLVAPYEAAALKLKPGEISDPIESQFGFHLIQLIERRGNEYNSRHILLKPDYSTTDLTYSVKYLDSLRNMIMLDSITFEKAAIEYSKDKMTSVTGGMFTNRSGSTLLTFKELDSETYFTIDTMKVGQISRPIAFDMPTGEKAVRIVFFKAKVPPHQANLDQDYERIRNTVIGIKEAEAIEKWFRNAIPDVFISIEPEYDYCGILDQAR